MQTSQKGFRKRILFSILVPVLVMGIILAVVISNFVYPPLITFIKNRTDTELKLASSMAIEFCEERFQYLLDLRLENDRRMLAAVKTEAVEEIKSISRRLHRVHLLVLENEKNLGSSFKASDQPTSLELRKTEQGIREGMLFGKTVQMHSRYFPLWRWHIVSFMLKSDYLAPISMTRKAFYMGTLGVLLMVVLTVTLVFYLLVNRPLKKIISATEKVSRKRFERINLRRGDEIGRVAQAFDAMVDSLEDNQNQLEITLKKLGESEETYRIITEHSLALIIMVKAGRIFYGNQRTAESTGYAPKEITGMEVWRLFHPDDRDLVERKLSGLLKKESDFDRFETRYQTKKEETRWLEVLAVPSQVKESPVLLIHAIDITERKSAEEESTALQEKLQRAQKMEAIGTLASGVAHDLNNILSGIVSYPELLLLDLPEESPLRGPITTIQSSGKKAAAMVQDLLTLARRGVAVTEVISLNQLIKEYLGSPEFQTLSSFHPGVKWETQLEKGLLNIQGSPVHLLKTIMNLASNAAEAISGKTGAVVITTANRYIDRPLQAYDDVAEGDYVMLSIVDNGMGISPDDIEHIFEPFYSKKVMGRSGTGLGMSVVWATVKDHKGYVDVASTEGKGTRFDLYFPVTREEILEKEPDPSLKTLGGSEKILVIDDVEEQREIASAILRKLGYAVETVSSGEEAVEYVKDNPVDLLVLDMIMDPGIDGLETYRRITSIRPEQKAIIASGFSESHRVKEAKRLGVRSYIKKPYSMETLATAIREVLSKAD